MRCQTLWIMLALLLMLGTLSFLTGCGSGKPDPRDRPNFVDTTDPRMVGSAIPDPSQQRKKSKNGTKTNKDQ